MTKVKVINRKKSIEDLDWTVGDCECWEDDYWHQFTIEYTESGLLRAVCTRCHGPIVLGFAKFADVDKLRQELGWDEEADPR